MQEFSALAGVVAALTVGVISPGPSFVMIARTAVSSTRSNGIAAALGMGVGGVLFALAALLGLQAVLLPVPSLYLVLKVAGGVYLGYLGFRIWSSARQGLAMTGDSPGGGSSLPRSFALGFVTQVSNPKTAIVYASVFAAFLPAAPSLSFDAALVAIVYAIEAGWYSIVALALSSERPRRAYLRYKAGIDRVAGGVMMGLGLKLVLSAHRA
ncbi:MAG TPA: LysE family translocator [Burkholderiaceae bacterium]|jgi:threonine/homoserine/homoserine lactone efflux protein